MSILNKLGPGSGVDETTQATAVIDITHKIIHDGMMFTTTGKQTGWTNGTSQLFLISVPADTFPHVQSMRLSFSRGDIDFTIHEGTTTSADGSALPIANINRNSANTPDLDLFAQPTVTDNGTLLYTLWVPPTAAGTGQTANGVENIGQGHEWILPPSTKYLATLTNNSGATISWSYEFTWYEPNY